MKSSFIYYIGRATVFIALSLVWYVSRAVDDIVETVRFAVREFIQVAAAFVWRAVSLPAIVAFRVIEILKPVYRDSYETFGLSLRRDDVVHLKA